MPKKLLLAEDSLTIQKVFDLTFAQSDVAITAVDNGNDAVRLAGEIHPDLVVADVTLPGKDGYTVAAELRAMEKTRDIPVLILSGTLVPLDEQRFRASRASGVLHKPFESKDLLEKVEGLLHKGAEPPAEEKAEGPRAGDERWDFSDVLEEVEAETAKPAAPAAAPGRDEALPGPLLTGVAKPVGVSFNDFDVSLEEIGGGGPSGPPSVPPAPPAKESHIEGSIVGDAPPPVTDLAPALEPLEEIEDIEEMEEMEEMEEVELPAEAPERLRPIATSRPAPSAPPQEAFAAEPPAPASPPKPEPAVAPVVPPPAGIPAEEGGILTAEIRERFSARADEIFRTVASEAVEKVMWEMTDRLAAEFSAKVRESVEAVAWEVIPATAEALIREEIARIRQKAGKLTP